MPPPPSIANDFLQFQDLIKRVADSLQIPLEEVKESQHKLLDILHSVTSARVALPINKALVEPENTIWQTFARVTRTCKGDNLKSVFPTKISECLVSHPPPSSLMVEMMIKRGKQHWYKSTTYDRPEGTGSSGEKILPIGNPTVLHCEIYGIDGQVQLHKLCKI